MAGSATGFPWRLGRMAAIVAYHPMWWYVACFNASGFAANSLVADPI
jgi:hypothetical protein